MRRPDSSDLAALAWIGMGLATSAALQAASGGQHSISGGLRRHPAPFGGLAVLFLLHIYKPSLIRPFDPLRAVGSYLLTRQDSGR